VLSKKKEKVMGKEEEGTVKKRRNRKENERG
jgi:hypothetical protein